MHIVLVMVGGIVVRVPRLRPDTGLCEFDHVDRWFKANKRAREAARICLNCPIIVACGEKALQLGVTDGVWASVEMPGARNAADLEDARAKLREVIARFRHQSPQSRLRSLRIRQAVHFAAIQRQTRPVPAPHSTDKKSA